MVQVGARHFAAHRRALGIGGVDHVRHFEIDAEQGFTRHDGGVVRAAEALAEKAVLVAGFQLKGFLIGHRQRARLDREIAVTELAPARGVDHFTVQCRQLARRDAPFTRGSRDEHRARRSARLTQLIPAQRDRTRTAGALATVYRRINGSLGDVDVGPRGVQFLGDDQREGGLDALADLGAF